VYDNVIMFIVEEIIKRSPTAENFINLARSFASQWKFTFPLQSEEAGRDGGMNRKKANQNPK
jgi:pantoate kinase